MSPPSRKTVALIDPLWVGHHPMYFSQFTASFLRCGARVISLCPEPERAREDLTQALAPGTAAEMLGNVHFAKLPIGQRSFFNGRFEGDPARTFQRWRNAVDALADTEAESRLRADLVYFPYLDSYLRFFPFPVIADILLDRPWSGLYLRNHHHGETASIKQSLRLLAKGDAILRSRNCRGIGVLDERFIPEMESLTRKPVTAFPDVTDGDLPSDPFPLALEIQRKATGRKIVGIIGLERRKGFLTLLRTARLAALQNLPLYFVCAGPYYPEELSDQEQHEISDLLGDIDNGTLNNLHFDPTAGRIADEKDFNFLFASFDIAWAAYESFHGSSGTLSKAAEFEIPCIATARECVGNRVESYHLGETITQATPELALSAISKLVKTTVRNPAPRYAAYREHHSRARLDQLLSDLLTTV